MTRQESDDWRHSAGSDELTTIVTIDTAARRMGKGVAADINENPAG